ncbi:MAG TPA: hypothetical protein PKV73_18055, partial [Agriterribacter sp.]|nr:hypothetical protein [Agriterribacter sp.]
MFSVRSGMMVLGLALSTMFILPSRDDRKRSFQNCAPCDSIPDNKARALLYCSSCHLFPEPSLLDKKTWVNNVLPNMGWRLGIRL